MLNLFFDNLIYVDKLFVSALERVCVCMHDGTEPTNRANERDSHNNKTPTCPCHDGIHFFGEYI